MASVPQLSDITVPYRILIDGTGQGSINTTGATDTINFIVSPGDVEQFIEDVGGASYNGIPMQHPLYLGLYANSASWSLIPADPSTHGGTCSGADYLNAFQRAKVSVTFATPEFNWQSTDEYTLRLNYSANMITMPEAAYKFASGLPVPHGVGRNVPQVEFSVTKYLGATEPNRAVITALTGTVNDATYLGCAAGTLLFAGAKTDITKKFLGTPTYVSEYAFIFRPIAWNYFLKPDGSAWEVVLDPNGDPVYSSGNFLSLDI